jgi:hypothetical protein
MDAQALLEAFPPVCDLREVAAEAAANELVDNWADAIRDGESLEDLLDDVDGVIAVLNEWRENLKAK